MNESVNKILVVNETIKMYVSAYKYMYVCECVYLNLRK